MAQIKVSVVDDVAGFLAGMGKVEGAFDQVAGSLDDMAREAQSAARSAGADLARDVVAGAADATTATGRLETELRTAATAARTSGRDVERSFADLADAAKRESRTAGRALRDEVDDGAGRATASVGEFKDEARSNFSEVASSFAGDMDSAADLVQGTLGGLASGLPGPLGIISGLLAAVGGGMYASFHAEAEKTEERIAAMYDDMVESGNNFLSQQLVQNNVAAIFGRTDEAAIKWKELQEIVAATGATEGDVARAFAGDQRAAADPLEMVRAKRAEVTDTTLAGAGEETAALAGPQRELLAIIGRLEEQQRATDEAAARAVAYRDTVAAMAAPVTANVDGVRDAFGRLKSSVEMVPTTRTITVEADLSGADRAIRNWRPMVLVNTTTADRPGFYRP